MPFGRLSLSVTVTATLTMSLVAQAPGGAPARPTSSALQTATGQSAASLVEYDAEVQRSTPGGVDFTGEWAPRFHEDEPERVPGPELGDYLGIPISDAARL